MIEYYSIYNMMHTQVEDETAYLTRATSLPRVLIAPIQGDSLSMERALKQIRELLKNNIFDPTTTDEEAIEFQEKSQASIDAVDIMLAAIRH